METEVELARIVERIIESESMRNLEGSYIYGYVLSGIYGLLSPRIPLLRFQGSLTTKYITHSDSASSKSSTASVPDSN